jgi:2'-5' RNA ligase superfamily
LRSVASVCAFDAYSYRGVDAVIRSIWKNLRARDIPSPLPDAGARPHVSFCAGEDCDSEALKTTLTGRVFRLRLSFGYVRPFPTDEGVVYLSCEPEPALVAVHREIWQIFERVAVAPRAYYAPGVWIPHCTLTYDVASRVPEVIRACESLPLPKTAEVTGVGLVSVSTTSVKHLWTIRYPIESSK